MKKYLVIVLPMVWIFSTMIVFMFDLGLATRQVRQWAAPELIPPNQRVKDIHQVALYEEGDQIVLTVCLDMQRAYTEDFALYSITKTYDANFSIYATQLYPRSLLQEGCEIQDGARDLLQDAREAKSSETEVYYVYRRHGCNPMMSSVGLSLGCLVNPKQTFGKVTMELEGPEYQYIDHSHYRGLYPVAWVVDALLSPLYVLGGGVMLVLWGLAGGAPAMP